MAHICEVAGTCVLDDKSEGGLSLVGLPPRPRWLSGEGIEVGRFHLLLLGYHCCEWLQSDVSRRALFSSAQQEAGPGEPCPLITAPTAWPQQEKSFNWQDLRF